MIIQVYIPIPVEENWVDRSQNLRIKHGKLFNYFIREYVSSTNKQDTTYLRRGFTNILN
jgi:hypothetical protein